MTWTRWKLGTLLAAAALVALPMTASANTIGGTLTPGVYADIWSFIMPGGGGSFTATTTTPADTQLFLFDGSMNGLWANDSDNAGGHPDTLTGILPGGTYYLAVTLWDVDPYASNGGLIFPSHGDGYQYTPDNPDPAFAYWAPLPPTSDQPYSVDLTGGTGVYDHPDIVATPEPASMTLFGTGIIGLCGRAWRRRRQR